ncbi:MAG: hypothetical protein ACJ72Q_21705 [Nitrososphaeraceae archaeon]
MVVTMAKGKKIPHNSWPESGGMRTKFDSFLPPAIMILLQFVAKLPYFFAVKREFGSATGYNKRSRYDLL